MNVDKDEIKKFDEFAEDWWNPEGKMKPLHQLNPIRLAYIQQFVELTEKNVLDVGCGGGLLSEAMARESAIVTGIDLSESVIKVAKQHALKKRVMIDYQCISVEELAQDHLEAFQVITCMEMLEHVPDPRAILKACFDCLEPGGKLFLSTLNRNLKSYLGAILIAEYVLKLLPKGTHEYKKFIRPSELNRWASEVGFKLVNLKGLEFNPLQSHWSLSENVSINYLVCYEKPTI